MLTDSTSDYLTANIFSTELMYDAHVGEGDWNSTIHYYLSYIRDRVNAYWVSESLKHRLLHTRVVHLGLILPIYSMQSCLL